MGELFDRIVAAVNAERFLVSWHADERCEQRQVAVWQVVTGLERGRLQAERPTANHAIVVGGLPRAGRSRLGIFKKAAGQCGGSLLPRWFSS